MSGVDNWGCPDWRNQEAYPVNGDDLKRWEWRWELLRRTPNYRMLWEKRSEPGSTKYVTNLNIKTVDYVHHLYNLDSLIDPATPLSAFKESPFTSKAGDSFSLPSKQSLEGEWFKERGIEPTNTEAKLNYLINYLELVGLLESSTHPDPGSLFKFFRIDLVHPITDQLKHIRLFEKEWKDLEERRKTESGSDSNEIVFPKKFRFEKKDRKNWPIYLRLIDAKHQSAKDMEIYNQISNELEKKDVVAYDNWYANNPAVKIGDMLKAAESLMIKGSLFL
jgi:hypothetical protein